MTAVATLIHVEDSYLLEIDGMTQAEVIERLNNDGYKMGRTSLQNLLSGKSEQSCGFTYQMGVAANDPAPDLSAFYTSTRDLENPAQGAMVINADQFITKAEVITETGKASLRDLLEKVNPLADYNPKQVSRNKREGAYAGCFGMYDDDLKRVLPRSNNRVGHDNNYLSLKEESAWRKKHGFGPVIEKNRTQGRGRRNAKSFYRSKADRLNQGM